MRAITLRAPGPVSNFEETEIALPSPGPGDVRIRMRAASFNPIDVQLRRNEGPGLARSPEILGRDLAGVIDAIGTGVHAFKPGDDVMSYVARLGSSGTYAEYVCVPAELVARMPTTLSHAQAAAVPVAGITASLALDKLRAGEVGSLFVAGGAGGVGNFAIRLARLRGVRRIVTTAGNDKSRAHLLAHCGMRPEDVLDYRVGDIAALAVAAHAGPFDAALDLVGGRMLSACCAVVRVDGSVASVVDGPEPGDIERLFERNASFHAIGAHAYSLGDRAGWLHYRNILDSLAALFDSGALSPPVITDMGRLSIDSVASAHRRLEQGSVQGKLVLTLA
jgi:NADPH2:quinone reductase